LQEEGNKMEFRDFWGTEAIRIGDKVMILDISDLSDKYSKRSYYIGKKALVHCISPFMSKKYKNYNSAYLTLEGETQQICFFGVLLKKIFD
jgi:hypothetical protein